MIESDGGAGTLVVRRWWRLCWCYRLWLGDGWGRESRWCPRHGGLEPEDPEEAAGEAA